MSVMPRPRGIALLALVPAVALLAAALILDAAQGPPYRDPKRGVEKQRQAATDAAATARKGREAAEEVLKLLGDDSGVVRDAVWDEVVKWDAEDLLALVPGLGAKDEIVARNVAEALGKKKVAAARGALEGKLKKRQEPLTLAEVVRALAEIGDAASKDEVERVFKGARDPMLAGAALVALTRLDEAGAVARLEKVLGDDDVALRIIDLARLDEIDEAKAAKAAVAALKDKEKIKAKMAAWAPRLLFQACDVLVGIDDRGAVAETIREAIDVLIERIDGEDGRPKHEVGDALRGLTGNWDLEDDGLVWKTWWETNRDKFDPGSVKKGKPKEPGAGGGTMVRYHGIPIYAKRLSFLLDCSGGMDRTIDPNDPETMRRLDYAKRELVKVLKALADDVAANVMFFGSAYEAASEQLVLLKKGRASLVAFAEKQEIPTTVHMNRGNIYDPLIDAVNDPQVDTVFLLSEGNPTEGLYNERHRFIAHLKRHNALAKCRVFTLFAGNAGSARGYVREIAEATGGEFYDVGEGPGQGGGGGGGASGGGTSGGGGSKGSGGSSKP